jgi:hypothetical protein
VFKNVFAATEADTTMGELLEKKHATIGLLEIVFSEGSTTRLYTGDRNGTMVSS